MGGGDERLRGASGDETYEDSVDSIASVSFFVQRERERELRVFAEFKCGLYLEGKKCSTKFLERERENVMRMKFGLSFAACVRFA